MFNRRKEVKGKKSRSGQRPVGLLQSVGGGPRATATLMDIYILYIFFYLFIYFYLIKQSPPATTAGSARIIP